MIEGVGIGATKGLSEGAARKWCRRSLKIEYLGSRLFPWSIDHGLIEAAAAQDATRKAVTMFPWSIDHGLIEAKPVDPIRRAVSSVSVVN